MFKLLILVLMVNQLFGVTFKDGVKALKNGDKRKALEIFRTLEKENPYVDVSYGLGMIYFKKKNYEIAEEFFQNATNLKVSEKELSKLKVWHAAVFKGEINAIKVLKELTFKNELYSGAANFTSSYIGKLKEDVGDNLDSLVLEHNRIINIYKRLNDQKNIEKYKCERAYYKKDYNEFRACYERLSSKKIILEDNIDKELVYKLISKKTFAVMYANWLSGTMKKYSSSMLTEVKTSQPLDIDVDKYRSLLSYLGVRSIPSILYFKNNDFKVYTGITPDFDDLVQDGLISNSEAQKLKSIF